MTHGFTHSLYHSLSGKRENVTSNLAIHYFCGLSILEPFIKSTSRASVNTQSASREESEVEGRSGSEQ